ncbi:GlxA family transcriptional regulator [Nonomuraea indica]|uniref:GlxA family transcriptional regulator n=1 Tax=Nonomuraea indica TaxID=1581193 RepID=A0ABW8ADK0_9ACTN
MSAFALGAIGGGFTDRAHLGLPAFRFVVCAETPGMVRTDLGLPLRVTHGLDRLAEADLIMVLPGDGPVPRPSPAVSAALRAAHRREAIIVAFSAGVYLLADARLLDGRRATTHWTLTDDFATRFPRVNVVPQALYVDEGRLVTGAGGAACVDVCMHLLRREHGATVANAVAREMVTAPHREGDQVQYRDLPVPGSGEPSLGAVIDWLLSNLDRPVSIGELADRALMSERTFSRRFKAVTGATPYSWLLAQRLERASELLEVTNLSIEEVSRQVGYNTVAVFRQQFTKRHGIPPRAYRRRFHRIPDSAGGSCGERIHGCTTRR